MNDVRIRPCTPDDARLAAQLIYSTGPASFRYVLSIRSQEEVLTFLEEAFRHRYSIWSFTEHEAVEVDGAMVGIGSLQLAKNNLPFMVGAAWRMLRFYGLLAGMVAIFRGLRAETVVRPPSKGVGILAHLAMVADWRGKGLGQHLVHHLLGRISDLELPRAELDVAVTNPRARALYQRIGFRSVAVRRGGMRSRFGHMEDQEHMTYPMPADQEVP